MATPDQIKRNTKRKSKSVRANQHGSVMTGRKELASGAGQHFQGDRDMYAIMGYPRHIDPAEYVSAYERQDIASRIVDAYPDATWREPPEVKGEAGFLESFSMLASKMNLWRAFHRLDRLMNLGHYAVMYIGLDGAEDPATPAANKGYRVLFLQPHSERTADITKWEDNPKSPRFGMPQMYRITTGINWTGAGAGQRTMNVHHSRVIHVAERSLEDISIGTPRLKGIYNRLMDLDKLLGGSAEMYWQNVAMLMSFTADADVEWEPEEAQAMTNQLEEMQHGLRRMLRLRGVTGENLAPGLQGADPGSHIEKQIDVIAGTTGIPKRILLGNEAGELASTQDETAWQGRVAERREQLATPVFIDQFIQALTDLGVLPSGFAGVEWPESDTLGERGRAEVAVATATALQNYTNALGAEDVVTREEFRQILGYKNALRAVADPADGIDEDSPAAVAQFGNRQNRDILRNLKTIKAQ